jgi:CPA1 family monovalent cation:H+ antiporter
MGNLQVVAPSSFKNTTCNNATIPPEFSPILELHEMYDLFACVLTVCGLVGLINYHRLKFPLPISLSLTALLMSLILIAIDGVNSKMPIRTFVTTLLAHGEFGDIVLSFGVGFLLFAAAMESNIKAMGQRWGIIIFLSVIGVLISITLIGTVLYGTFVSFGFYEPLTHNFLLCLLFGAIVSSTEIHKFVLEALKEANAPDVVSGVILGESLLNDGVAVVAFIIFKKLIDEPVSHDEHHEEMNGNEVWSDIAKDLFGGIFIGIIFACIFGAIMKKVRQPNLNTLLSVVLVLDITMVANRLESSSPMACVSAGLMIRSFFYENFERRSQQELDIIWEFASESLSGVFFLLIGFTIVSLPFSVQTFFASLVAVPVVLITRYIAISFLLNLWNMLGYEVDKQLGSVLTWGSIRGGASVALAMSLNNYEGRETVFSMTYAVVLFSLIGQGMTIPKVFKWLYLPKHVKEKDSNKIMGERDEILSKLLDAVSTSPELKEHLGKQGIDTDRLSQISGHTGSDSDSQSRDGMGGSPRLGTSPEDMRTLMQNAQKASIGSYSNRDGIRSNYSRSTNSFRNSQQQQQQQQMNKTHDYVPGVGRVTRRYSKSSQQYNTNTSSNSGASSGSGNSKKANEYSKVKNDYNNKSTYGTGSSMNVPMSSPQNMNTSTMDMNSPQRQQQRGKRSSSNDLLNASLTGDIPPHSNQDDSPLNFVDTTSYQQ